MTRTCLIEAITTPDNRQRRDFDPEAIQELVASIQESYHGLMHPVVVRDGPDDTIFLVAGERRLRAIKEIYDLGGSFRHDGGMVPVGQVPVVSLGELAPLAAFEAELEENIRRKDLTVIETAQATARLFDLRIAQAAAAGQEKPTTADLAREVFDLPPSRKGAEGSAQTAVRNQLLVAKNASNPEVRRAKTLKEAVTIVKKADQAAQAARLAATVGSTYSTKALKLLNEDSLVWLKDRTGEFDIILTDPPYGMGAQEFGDGGRVGAGAHFYDDSYETWAATMQVFVPATFSLTKPEAHAYLFCDVDRFFDLREQMRAVGWDVHRTPLIWHNPDGYRAPWPDRGPQRQYELVLYATKGGKKTAKLLGDVITCRKDASVGHPAQKPVELLKNLLSRSAQAGDKVLDPFAGSGATLEACHAMLLECTGLEKDQAAYGVALKRIQALDN